MEGLFAMPALYTPLSPPQLSWLWTEHLVFRIIMKYLNIETNMYLYLFLLFEGQVLVCCTAEAPTHCSAVKQLQLLKHG